MPSLSYTSDAAATRPSAPARSGTVPPTIHRRNRRADAPRKSCAGPAPSGSATARLSASFSPMKAKFSGSAARRAPRAAASSSSTPACSRFAATSGPDVICIAATFTLTSFQWCHYGGAPRTPQTQRAARLRIRIGAEQLAQRQPERGDARARPQPSYGGRQTLFTPQDPGLLVVVPAAESDPAAHQDFRVAVEMQPRGHSVAVSQLVVGAEPRESQRRRLGIG